MSILNLWYDADRALIACDTEAIDPDDFSKRQATSKAVHIPHLNSVIGCRGDIGLFFRVVSCALAAETVDELATEFSAMTDFARKGYHRPNADISCIVAGWSPKNSRMMAWRYKQPYPNASLIDSIIVGAYAAPGDHWPVPPEKPSIADLPSLMCAQAMGWRAKHPEEQTHMSVGGDVIAFELTKSDVTVRNLGPFLGAPA